MSVDDAARQEAERRYRDRAEFASTPGAVRNARMEAFEHGAKWQREQPVSGWPPHWTTDDILRDLHARYHCQEGNLLGRVECEWERCDFWDAAKFALIAAKGASNG